MKVYSVVLDEKFKGYGEYLRTDPINVVARSAGEAVKKAKVKSVGKRVNLGTETEPKFTKCTKSVLVSVMEARDIDIP